MLKPYPLSVCMQHSILTQQCQHASHAPVPTRRYTATSRVCPNLYALSCAWMSCAGFHEGSNTTCRHTATRHSSRTRQLCAGTWECAAATDPLYGSKVAPGIGMRWLLLVASQATLLLRNTASCYSMQLLFSASTSTVTLPCLAHSSSTHARHGHLTQRVLCYSSWLP